MSRSTLTDLFHAAAEKLAPLSRRLMQLVAESEIVQADETSLVMRKPLRATCKHGGPPRRSR